VAFQIAARFLVATLFWLAACAAEQEEAARAPVPLSAPTQGGGAGPQQQPLPADRAPQPLAARPQVEVYPGNAPAGGSVAAAPAAATDQAGDVTLNFANADIREVVRTVLGDVLKLTYVVDPKVQGTVTAQTSRALARDAVLPVLEVILKASGAALVSDNGVYRVVPLDDAARAALAGGLSITAAQRGLGFGLKIIPLKFIGAAEIQKVVEPSVPAGGSLRIDPARNLLIVSGAQAELNGFAELVQTLDVDFLAGMSFVLFNLQNASAEPVVAELGKIFEGDAEGPFAGVLRFVPLNRLNAVLAISSQRSYLDRARGWIERLDRPEAEGEPRLHVYYVQNSRAADLAAVLGDLFSSRNVFTELPQGITAPGTTPMEIAAGRTGPQAPGQTPSFGRGAAGAGNAPLSSSGIGAGSTPLQGPQIGQASAAPQTGRAGQARRPGGTAAGGPGQAPGLDQGLGPGPGAGAGAGGPSIRIVADEKNNALVIYTAGRDYRMIQDALRQLDIVPLQVLIEATIAEVTLNDQLRYGVQYFIREGNFRFNLVNPNSPLTGIVPTVPGFAIELGQTTPYAILSALTAITHVNVISSPQVMVLDHQSAFLQVGDQVPISTGQASNLNNPNTVLINTIQYRDTGVILTVTPRVNTNGLISMDIEQEVSAVAPTTTSTINSPTIQERRIQSSVAIQSGDTIALGGLIRDSRTRTKSGIPILSSIPVLGALFGTTDTTSERTELLVLLTPHAVGTAQQARELTDELRRRLRAIIPLGRSIQ
jgi:general secretion pathway protein D